MNSAEVLIKFKGDTSSADKATNEVSTSLTKLTKAFTLGSIASKGISKGIEILTDNLDNAIKRVDTLNNFPKVMSNLGISAEDSSDVINDLSKKLQGLPTSIDSAAMAVQRFTSKNGNVKESEKIFLAVNNAILAGGANADIQASALEQLSQAYAKGKPDMMEWRTLMTAMPAQLKQVATAMGYTDAALLGEAVRAKDGEKEFARMMDTMMKMNTEGVNGFKSFEDQARNSTGGIQTNIKNMKTAFVRGIADIIKQLDNALEPFGGLGGVITSMGKIGEKVFKKLGSILSTVIKAFIKLAQWINKNKAWIIPLTVAVATFIATFKTIKTVIAIINTVKAAMVLLNATLMANPIALIVAAIAALVAAFIYLWNNCEAFRNFWIGLWNGIKNVIKGAIDFIKGLISIVVDAFKFAWAVLETIIIKPFQIAFTFIGNTLNNFINVVKTIIGTLTGLFSGFWNTLKSGFEAVWSGIKSVFSGVGNFFKNVFMNAWNVIKGIFSAGGQLFEGIKDGVANVFKTMVNLLIKGINNIISVPFKTINGLLNTIRNVKIPVINKKPFKGLWKQDPLPVPKIPQLATGTNKVPDDMLAMIHKGEAVVPKKFNPYTSPSNSMYGAMNNSRGKQVINVYASFKQDNLGQMVRDIKTFSGGARNDYNYGAGV